jgi:Leucine-rich repeat (LRR) protein
MKKMKCFILAGLSFAILGCSSDAEATNENTDGPVPPVALTAISDPAFEQVLVELGVDDVVDGFVETGNAEMVTSLVMNDKGISSLQGIEDFVMLETLQVSGNEISSLNLSQNSLLKFIFIQNNGLTGINVNNLNILEKLSVSGNNLTQLDISDNPALQLLEINDNTIGAIDLSGIPNSIQLNTFAAENNPLTCIKVNQEILDNIPAQWTKDAEDIFALSCN